MYICGTVRRPVRSIISVRFTGSRSTRILVIWVTPFEFSRRSAIMQKGQTPLLYIFTAAIWESLRVSSRQRSLLHRQACLHPAADAAAQREYFAEAVFPEHAAHSRRAHAGLAVDDDRARFESLDFAQAPAQFRQRNIARVRYMARGKIRLVAHIEHQGVAAVDELHRLGRADLRRATDAQAVDQRPHQHAA